MPKKEYGKFEESVKRVFVKGESFVHDGIEYEVLIADKPRPSSGECKTDVYVKGVDSDDDFIELKISAKLESAAFLQNKVNADAANAIFGKNWSKIISKAALSIRDKFENRPIVFASKSGRTMADSITLGWKLEISNEPKPRPLSSPVPLTNVEVRDLIYRGIEQDDDKRNARVEGEVVHNSGVADYLLIASEDDIDSPDDVLSRMEDIDTVEIPETYLIFTANNYRTREDKTDGNRPLAVYIEWGVVDSKLTPTFRYDNPLKVYGREDVKPSLADSLRTIGKMHPSDFDEGDIDKKYLHD